MKRRGKGEASFLHCKSPGREEANVMNRGRGMEGRKRQKESEEENLRKEGAEEKWG